MKGRNLWSVTTVIFVYLSAFLIELLALSVNAYTSLVSTKYLLFAEIVIFIILIIFGVYKIINQHKDAEKNLEYIFKNMSGEEKKSFLKLKIPVTASDKQGNFIWYNESFKENVIKDEAKLGENINDIFAGKNIYDLEDFGFSEIKIKNKFYTVYKNPGTATSGIDIYYFVDITAFKSLSVEYKKSRPVVALITIDNVSEILSNVKESEKAVLLSKVEDLLEKWAGKTNGLMRKYDSRRFIMVMEERHLKEYIDDKFDILNKVRAIKVNGKESFTLSMGIGRGGETLSKNEDMARQALDMALGRGGDHVAIKSGDKFEFFGGVSGGTEKRTKVKTRVIASTLKKLIEDSERVFVMGHRFGDLDSLGASIGICKIAESLGKDAFVVTDDKKTLASQLLNQFRKQCPKAVLTEDEAKHIINQNTLLVVVDTHRPEFLEFRELYDLSKNVVVIDHHRKMVEHIEDAVVFFHEPTASSTCEMVAEMLEYIGSGFVGEFEATALLAGIMLDTKNFVIRTGARTFEAAGALRLLGADPVEARAFFANTLSVYKLKSDIVSNSKRYADTAISIIHKESPDSRIAASQAADEMLSIDGVKASFVIFATDGIINISARSFGKINVQLIMELLGGGGHQTMAAAQLTKSDFADAELKLCRAIDDYKNKAERK